MEKCTVRQEVTQLSLMIFFVKKRGLFDAQVGRYCVDDSNNLIVILVGLFDMRLSVYVLYYTVWVSV